MRACATINRIGVNDTYLIANNKNAIDHSSEHNYVYVSIIIQYRLRKMESLDYSDYDNGSTTQEFPYWQPLIAIEIILNFAVILPSTLFWNLTVFTTLIKSKLSNNPLTVLYSSLLLVLCMDKIVAGIVTATVSPDVVRFCSCNILTDSFLLAFNGFSVVFSILIITFQSLLQLQIIRGKKQWNSYGRIIPCIGVSILAGMFWYTMFLIQQILLPASSNPCQPLCIQNATSTTLEAEYILTGAFVVSTLLPASIMVIVTSVWSAQLFKKMSIRQKIQEYNTLNKKLLLMPILMLSLILCNLLLGFFLSIALSEVLQLAGVEDYLGNWAYFVRRMTFACVGSLHGVSYPITLLYFNTKLRKDWKKYLTRRSNRVNSETTTQ